jgi:folate-dependent phosphoribosylglycinamide formyltransferase PurN
MKYKGGLKMNALTSILERLEKWVYDSTEFDPVETLDNYLEVEEVELLVQTVKSLQEQNKQLQERNVILNGSIGF